MKVHVKFRTIFREVFGMDEMELDLDSGANILSLLNILCDSQDRRAKIFDSSNTNLRRHVTITKNGRFILHLNWLQTELFDGDKVEILMLAAGG